MSGETERLLAVLGSPISHSKSPRIHRAAYDFLGLAWEYGAIEVTAEELPEFISSRSALWRGLSLTMPLKRVIVPYLAGVDETVHLTGVANTVLFDGSAGAPVLRGYNTDVYGISQSFRCAGIDSIDSVHLIGSGATAASALVAVSQLGARRAVVSARTPAHARFLHELGTELGIAVNVVALDSGAQAHGVDAVISTIPQGAPVTAVGHSVDTTGSVLLEVAYDPWPTPLATEWGRRGGATISGLEMLLHQAIMQVRIFLSADPDVPLRDEPLVLAAMRRSVEAH